MADTFQFTDNYKKTFIGMVILGAILFAGGFFLSNASFGDDHGHGGHGTDTEHHDEGHGGDGHHSDAGKLVQFASAEKTAVVDNHDGHGDGHHEIEESAYMSENGTVWRAPVHPEQVAHHGEHHEKGAIHKIGSSLLMAGWWWLAVALFGVFFQAFSYTANAGWYVNIKRVPEVFYRFIPIGGLILLIVFLAMGKDIYEWRAVPAGEDHLIDLKRSFLNPTFYISALLVFVGLWTFFGHILRQNSLKEENEGGLAMHRRSRMFSAAFLPIFAVSFSIAAFQWMMSLEPHWFSTMFSVYMFAGTFVSGILIIMLIVISLKEKGYMDEVTGEHIHDLGKFMFAFSVFWAYIWVSQFLLIWYANIPEETIYYFNRLKDYKFLFFLNVVLNFLFPFLALMTRKSKRSFGSIKTVAVVMLLGRFLDIFLVVMPGVMGEEWNGGVFIMSLGMMILMGGVFFFAVFSGLGKAKLIPKNHPYYEESVHHSTGV